MNAAHELGPEGRVNRAVARQPALPGECRGPHPNPEVALPAFAVARVTAVALAFVEHLESLGRKCPLEPLADLPRHFSLFGQFHHSPLHTQT